MNNESSGNLRKVVNRSEFFRWGADALKQFGKEMISVKLDQMDEFLGEGKDWTRVADEQSIGIIPRLFFVKGTPIFVIREEQDTLIAFSANCPEDAGLLEWRENSQSFCCPFCQSKFDRRGKSCGDSTNSLQEHKTKITEGQVSVSLTNSSKQLI